MSPYLDLPLRPLAQVLRERQARDHIGRFVKMCEGCGVYQADLPSKLCLGCEAYRDHQR